eukprot:COSAG06_NODE_4449_length_4252_cov_21.903443_2_plen_308_part_00
MHERLMPYGCMLVWLAGLDKTLRAAAYNGDAAGVREWLDAGADPNAPSQAAPAVAAFPAALAADEVASIALPAGWEQRMAYRAGVREHGIPYYVNHHTRTTTWDRPTATATPAPDRDGEGGVTAMHWAAAGGKSVEVLEVLRGAGAEVDKATEDGVTPLMWAARNGATGCGAVLRWLLEHGADWRLQATSGALAGETALGIAKRQGEAEAASVLAAWVSEHGSAKEAAAAAAVAQEAKQRGETPAALSTPNCCRHASPELACLGKMVDLSSAQQLVVHQARFISSTRLACLIMHVLIIIFMPRQAWD